MILATSAVATSVTFSLIYTIFYSIGTRTMKLLDRIDLNFKYVAAYSIACVFILAEFGINAVQINEDGLTILELSLYVTIAIAVLTLILL